MPSITVGKENSGNSESRAHVPHDADAPDRESTGLRSPLPGIPLLPTRLLLFQDDLQQLQGFTFCLFRRLFGSLRRFLKCLVGDVLGIPHVVAGLPASAVVAHGIFLPSVRKYIFSHRAAGRGLPPSGRLHTGRIGPNDSERWNFPISSYTCIFRMVCCNRRIPRS
jgi:hypothetical protein